MKNLILIFLLAISFSTFAQKQNNLANIVDSYHKVANSFQSVDLFSVEDKNLALNTKIKNDGLEGKATLLSINELTLNSILQNPQKTLSISIPNGTKNPTELELFRSEFTAPDFKVNSLDGNGNVISSKTPEQMVFYHGIIKGNAKSLVAISFSKNEVYGLVSDSLDNYSIGKIKDSESYFYCNSIFISSNTNYVGCGTSDDIKISNNAINLSPITGCKVVRITVLVDFDYYRDIAHSNLTAAETSIRFIFNQAAAIYREDDMAIQMESLNIYESPSSFSFITGTNSGDGALLNTYESAYMNQHNVVGDILHLFLGRQTINAGGRAGSIGTGVCVPGATNSSNAWSYAYYVNKSYPTYTWPVAVFAHEIGHVLGSPHTHACFWNGNNTPIDNCRPSEGGCSPGPNPINGGTIMSYCDNGGSTPYPLSNGFSSQPAQAIYRNINGRSCFRINNSRPVDLITNPLGTSAAVQWTDYVGYNSSRYQLQYRKKGNSSWISLTTNGSVYLRADNYNITGLEINTNYEWRVQTECSDWAYSTFKTFPTFGDISVPTYVFCKGESSYINLPVDGSQYIPYISNFYVELSDASGNFNSPVQIGLIYSYPAYGDFYIDIPYNMPIGTKYRIRIRMSDPDVIINYSYDIAIGTQSPTVKAITNCPSGTTLAWEVSYGGNLIDELRTMTPTNDGGMILFGSSNSDSNGGNSAVSDKSATNKGSWDYWAVKIDENGGKAWDFGFGGSVQDYGRAIVPTNDGGFLIGGFTNSPKSGDISQENKGNNLNDYWIVKISSNGQKLWDKRYGGTGNDELSSILPTSDGGFILAGRSNSPADGNKTHPAWFGSYDYWLIKIDADGNIIDDYLYGGGDDETAPSLTKLPDGGYLIGGSSKSNTTGNKTEPSWFNSYDYWIVKVNANLNFVWDKRYGGGGDDKLANIVVSSDGNYILAGSSESNITGDKNEPSWNNTRDFWVLKINSQNRNIIKQHRFGGNIDDACTAIIATPEAGFLLAGSSNSDASGDRSSASYVGSYDYWVVKIDGNLEKKWEKNYRGGGDDFVTSILPTTDGMYLLGGFSSSQSAGEHSRLSRGSYDYWTIKLSDCQTSSSTTINIGQKAYLTANGCLGTITWSNGETTNNIMVSPTINTIYTATCYYGCTSNVSSILNVTVIPCSSPANMFSIKSGLWSDISTWSCNTIPLLTDTLKINTDHTVTIDSNDGHAKQVDIWGILNYINGGKLYLNK